MTAKTIPSKEAVQAVRVLVTGDAMLDRYWFGAVDRISPEAPVPVARITRTEERLGGAANVAVNLSTLGVKASLLCPLGGDDTGRSVLHLLAQAGIKCLAEPEPALNTTLKLRVIGRAQQLMRLDFDHHPTADTVSRLVARYEQALMGQDVVLLSDYGKGALTDAKRMIHLARDAGKIVLVDPKGSDYERYTDATIITPNQHELAQVVGAWPDDATLAQRAQNLRERLGLVALVLTRAEGGISLFDANGHWHVRAFAREVFDVTGAGDTVIATLACMVGCGLPLRHALTLANRAAGLVVGRFGTASVQYEDLFP